jgi:hypothetical protein
MTVFLPGQEGMDIFRAKDVVISPTAPPALQGWWDDRGLWMVPIVDEPTISPGIDVTEAAMGVYKLPSTKEVVRFLHAALGHPTQATSLHGGRDDSILSAKLIRIAPETSSF